VLDAGSAPSFGTRWSSTGPEEPVESLRLKGSDPEGRLWSNRVMKFDRGETADAVADVGVLQARAFAGGLVGCLAVVWRLMLISGLLTARPRTP
jgi:hypothetical protein